MKSPSSLSAAVLAGPVAALLALALGTGNTLATDGTWILNGNSNWSNNTSAWSSNAIADGVGAIANFDTVVFSSNRTITLDTARTIGTLQIGNSPSNRSFNLVGANTLTLDNGGGNAQITFKDGGSNANLSVAVALNSNLLITNNDDGGDKGFFFAGSGGLSSTNGHLTITNTSNAASRTKFNSVVSDGTAGNSITYNQTAGWSEFTAANTFSGTTTNGGGLLHLGNTAGISLALQNSALNTTGSTFGTATAGLRLYAGITSLTLGGLIGNKDLNATGTGVFSTATSNYNLVSALTLNPGTGKSHTFSGAIENGAANMTLTKTGGGTQTLSGTNTYTGATFVDTGIFIISTGGSLGTSAVTVDSDATIGGDGSIAGSLALSAGADFLFSVSNTLDVTGAVTFGGFGITDLVGLDNTVADGTYTLINGPVNMANVSNVGFGNAYDLGGGKSAYLQAGSLELVVTSVPEPSTAVLCGLGLLGLLRRRRS